MTPGEIDRLVAYMPIIVRSSGISDWARQFCISMIGRTKRGAFTPTQKQISVMQKLVNEFQESMRNDDLIDRGG